MAYDARREMYLRSRGLTVLRFDNAVVTASLDHVCWTILSACRESEPAQRGQRIARR
jgi:very-short-patch-repair endonuclease